MKKAIIPVLFAVLVFFTACKREAKVQTDLAGMKLKGRVMFISTKVYSAGESNGKIVKGLPSKEDDISISDIDYSRPAERDDPWKSYSFNEKGYITDKYRIDHSTGKFYVRYSYKYDENNKKTVMEESDPFGSLKSRTIYKYDANGKLSEETMYTGNSNSCYNRKNYSYDEDGSEICEEYFRCDSFLNKTIRRFDRHGNVIEVSRYGDGDKFIYKNVNSYDGDGNITGEISYIANDTFPPHQNYFKYDDNGNLVSWCDVLFFKYEFDSNGNWTKRIEFDNGVLRQMQVTEREIRYYQ